MERVAVIGCGGSGKTTFSNRLAAALGLPVLHIDAHYWRETSAGRVESTPEEWAATHRDLIERPRWVIDGMKLGTLQERLNVADSAVFLDVSTLTCLAGVTWRRLRPRHSLRPELGIYEVGVSREFLRWIFRFRRVHRPSIVALLAESECDVIVLRSWRESRAFLTETAARQQRSARQACASESVAVSEASS